MESCVAITFDCLPLRSVERLDAPVDASPKYRALCERIGRAIEEHGRHNAYFLYNARCTFRLTNLPDVGVLEFTFEGVALTDDSDQKTTSVSLSVDLERETCDWLTEPVVDWFRETVSRAVAIEFDRYIAAGDLAKTMARLEALQKQCDEQGGYIGMYL